MRDLAVYAGMESPERTDVVVVGAGVAGLIAARDIARAGPQVILVEARGRIGGRVLTRRPIGNPSVELGPEFVHGDSEILWELVKESGITTVESPRAQWIIGDRGLQRNDDLWDRLSAVMRKIDTHDHESFGSWLRVDASDVTPEDRLQAREFVQNFHAGPIDSISAATLRDTRGGTEESQHRVANGYDRVPLTLAEQAYAAGVQIFLNSPVKTIRWRSGEAEITQAGQEAKTYTAKAVVVTIPLGVLKAPPGQPGAIAFEPDLAEKRDLWGQLPFGFVTRITLRFRNSFWKEPFVPSALRENAGADFGFLHAPGLPFPVWWSSAPAPMLIGWAGGPAARALAGRTREDVVQFAIRSLSEAFGCPVRTLHESLVDSFWHDWSADPYSRGGYSFSAAGFEKAPRRLAEPVDKTLFFAGEATAEPAELGTVSGALESGVRAAREVLLALLPSGQRMIQSEKP